MEKKNYKPEHFFKIQKEHLTVGDFIVLNDWLEGKDSIYTYFVIVNIEDDNIFYRMNNDISSLSELSPNWSYCRLIKRKIKPIQDLW